MTGIELSLLISQLAGPLMSGLFGGGNDQQTRQSFAGTGDTDPKNLLSRNVQMANSLGDILAKRASQPVNLPSAYVQQPGAYTGGGLPMPIGLVATDPALGNPSLLSRPGIEGLDKLFSGLSPLGNPGGTPTFPSHTNPPGTGTTPFDSFIPGNNIDPDGPLGGDAPLGDAFDNFFQTPFDQRTPESRQGTSDGSEPRQGNAAESRGPRRRSEGAQLVRADDLVDGNAPGDDLTKALGSVQLLMEAFR